MSTSPTHLIGRTVAVILLIGWIIVLANGYSDIIQDRSITLSTSSLGRALRSSAFAAPTASQRTAFQRADASSAPSTASSAPLGVAAPPDALPPVRVAASSAAATSTMSGVEAASYAASNAADGRQETAWQVPGDASGHTITLMFARPVRLREVRLLPGYATLGAATSAEQFGRYRRIKRVRLELTNAAVEAQLKDLPELQAIPVADVVTNFVRVVITETLPPAAANGRDVTAMSEAVAIGTICAPGACGAQAEAITALATVSGSWNSGTVVEKIAGEYARVYALSPIETVAPSVMLLKRQGSTWVVEASGASLAPDVLQRLGIPRTLLE